VLPSPYNPGAGAAPPVLAGREDILGDLDELITRASHFGRGGGPLIWTGVRGVGKTVAMSEARTRAARRDFRTAHLTADRSAGLASRIAEALATMLACAARRC